MTALSVDVLFDTAIRIQLLERSISITFSQDTLRIKFPTTRRLAEFLAVPHYYVLPYFASMEQEELVTRAERVGILTTAKGSRKMIEIMRDRYPKETIEILGQLIFEELLRKIWIAGLIGNRFFSQNLSPIERFASDDISVVYQLVNNFNLTI